METDVREKNLSIVVVIDSDNKLYFEQLMKSFSAFTESEFIFVINITSGFNKHILSRYSQFQYQKIVQVDMQSRLDYVYRTALEHCSKDYVLFVPHFFHFFTTFPEQALEFISENKEGIVIVEGQNFKSNGMILVSKNIFNISAFPLARDNTNFIGNFVASYPKKENVYYVKSLIFDFKLDQKERAIYNTDHLKYYNRTGTEFPLEINRVEPEKVVPRVSKQPLVHRPNPNPKSKYRNLEFVPVVSHRDTQKVHVANSTVLDKINIFVLSYERPTTTIKCVNSILENIQIQKKVFICDNNSSHETRSKLENAFGKNQDVRFYWNKENKWIQGLEQAVNENLADHFVFTDNDVILRKYDGDLINHMYRLLLGYNLGAVGVNIFNEDIAYGVGAHPRSRDVIFTSLLDTTFQLVRKDVYKNFNPNSPTRKFQFVRNHMSVRRYRCGWTCGPYYADHMWFDKEKEEILNGNLEYYDYISKKHIHLERETPTSYSHVKQFLKEIDIEKIKQEKSQRKKLKVSVTIPTLKSDGDVASVVKDAEENFSGEFDVEIFASCINQSASKNRNFCIEKAQGDIIVMIDDDITGFYPGWERDLIQPILDNDDISISSARLTTKTGDIAGQLGDGVEPYNKSLAYQKALHSPVTYLNVTCSAAIAFRKNIDVKFDENYGGAGYEDTDFCMLVNKRHPDQQIVINNMCLLVHLGESKGRVVDGRDLITPNRKLFQKKWGYLV